MSTGMLPLASVRVQCVFTTTEDKLTNNAGFSSKLALILQKQNLVLYVNLRKAATDSAANVCEDIFHSHEDTDTVCECVGS